MKKFISSILIIISLIMCITFTSCSSTQAEIVNHNLSKQAGYFECERRITVYNARTDMIILQLEGYIDISNNSHSELVITAKVGENEYKKNYVYLNDYTLYTVEDITGTHTNQYHYKWIFNPKAMIPEIEIK